MRVIHEAPVDHIGIPLPIIPSEDFPNQETIPDGLSRHHEFWLYGSEKFTQLGRKAIRASRLLKTERTVHNKGALSFHRYFSQSSGPENEQDQFNICVLSMAGYLP